MNNANVEMNAKCSPYIKQYKFSLEKRQYFFRQHVICIQLCQYLPQNTVSRFLRQLRGFFSIILSTVYKQTFHNIFVKYVGNIIVIYCYCNGYPHSFSLRFNRDL